MQKTLITQRSEEQKELQKYAREYDIECLRTKVKNDVEEYNLFRQTPYIADDKFNFYRQYLLEQIEQNIEELKKLVEEDNE